VCSSDLLSMEHGLDHLIAATILAGIFQIALGLLGVAKLMRFVPPSVMTGFINALAILSFLSQMPYLADFDVSVYVMVAVGLVIIFGLPQLFKAVPAPLVAILVLSVATIMLDISPRTVGDEGKLPDTFPVPLLPDVPLTLDTLTLIAPYSLTLALVGLMESLMTAKVVDGLTETPSDHAREARGQGLANMLVGFFGGMAGCAMFGLTMLTRKPGARTRISTFLAGTFLIVLCVALGDIVGMIPMAALVAVMIFVSIVTFDWRSISPGTVKKLPWTETLVMVITVVVVVATSNLALGVIVGVIVSMVLFARKAAMQADVTSVLDPEGGTRVYSVTGEVFFASTGELVDRFDYAEQGLTRVVIDMSNSHVWDSSAVAALDQVSEHFRRRDIQVEIVGLNEPSAHLHEELSHTPVVRI